MAQSAGFIRGMQRGLVGLVCAAALMACQDDEPLREPPVDRVEAVFDPEQQIIPLPNDAAMEDGNLPGLPGAEEGTAAAELSDYLSGLSGWPRTSGIEIPFSGPLDEASIDDDSVRLYRFDAAGELRREEVAEFSYSESEAGSIIGVVPAASLQPGAQYAVVATKGLKDSRANEVGAALPIFFAASKEPLVDADGQPALDVLPDEETAVLLEGLRQLYAPVFAQLEEGVGDEDPLAGDDIVSMARWTMMPETAAAFFPDESQVPLPNTAGLDPDGTFPDSAACYLNAEDTGPEDRNNVIFDEYVTNLSGWPDSTPITLPLTGPIDPASVGDDDVQVWKHDDGEWARIHNVSIVYQETTVDNCSGAVLEEPAIEIQLLAPGTDGQMVPAPMEVGAEYFAFATREITDVDGDQALVPEAPMLLTMQPYPLVDEDGQSLVSILGDEDAQTLEGVRQILAPLLEEIEAETELEYTDLSALWSWFTWNDTFAIFDPESGQIPFPNSALLGDDGTAQIPIPSGISPAQEQLLEALNQRPGFSQSAPGWVPLDGEIDEATLDHSSFLYAREGAGPVNEDALRIAYEPAMDRIIYETLVPLRGGAQYIGALTPDLKGANGRPVKPTPIMVFLSMEDPLIVDGESRVWALPDETAEDIATLESLESARNSFSPAFLFFDLITEYDRHEFGAVWGMLIEDPKEELQQYRALAKYAADQDSVGDTARGCVADDSCGPPDNDPYLMTVGDELEHPRQPGVMVDMTNVATVQMAAEFETATVDLDAGQALAEGEDVGFALFIPERDQAGGTCDDPFDVVIAQHGLGGDRWQAGMGLANELAAFPNCMATVAMDLPRHGGRAASASSLHPESGPADSGAGFLSGDFLDSKANFMQAMVDLFVLTDLIIGDDQGSALEGLVDGGEQFSGRLAFAGISLGGIVGVPFTAMEPAVTSVALNSAGGRLTWLLQGDEEGPSTIGEPLLDELAAGGLEPGSADFFEAMVFVQWLADAVDPFVFGDAAATGEVQTLRFNDVAQEFAPTTGDSCDSDSDCAEGWACEPVSGQDLCVEYTQPADVLLQMSVGDRTVVNRSTEALASVLGIDLAPTTFTDVSHAFVADVDEASDQAADAQCARAQFGAWLRSSLDGAAQLPEGLNAEQCQ